MPCGVFLWSLFLLLLSLLLLCELSEGPRLVPRYRGHFSLLGLCFLSFRRFTFRALLPRLPGGGFLVRQGRRLLFRFHEGHALPPFCTILILFLRVLFFPSCYLSFWLLLFPLLFFMGCCLFRSGIISCLRVRGKCSRRFWPRVL